MVYTCNDLPDKEVKMWAFAYEANDSGRSLALKATPYLCMVESGISKSSWYRGCYKIKKNGDVGKSRVSSSARNYAFTYAEAVIGYNELVDKQINHLKSLINECNAYKITG